MKNVVLATILVCAATSAHAQDFSANKLARRTVERRAIEAVNWGIPAVNDDRMYQAIVNDAKGAFNQIVFGPVSLTGKTGP